LRRRVRPQHLGRRRPPPPPPPPPPPFGNRSPPHPPPPRTPAPTAPAAPAPTAPALPPSRRLSRWVEHARLRCLRAAAARAPPGPSPPFTHTPHPSSPLAISWWPRAPPTLPQTAPPVVACLPCCTPPLFAHSTPTPTQALRPLCDAYACPCTLVYFAADLVITGSSPQLHAGGCAGPISMRCLAAQSRALRQGSERALRKIGARFGITSKVTQRDQKAV
jgi:hypothetical protein